MTSTVKKTPSKKYFPSKKTQDARNKLIELSVVAKEASKMIFLTTGKELGINECILEMYRDETGETEFKRADQWQEEGFKIKKGETAFRVWGSPIKSVKKSLDENNSESEGVEKKYKLWPMCCLFHRGQVEPFDKDKEPKEEEQREQAEESKEEQKQETISVNVKVSEFRQCVEGLERVFNVDRHACVGEIEKENWSKVCLRRLSEVESLVCCRAKPEDMEEREKIVKKVREFFNLNGNEPEPTPPNKPKKNQEKKGMELEAAAVREIIESPFVCENYNAKQENKIARLEDRASNARLKGESLLSQARKMGDVIPFGQPILIGHHSEKRDRNYRSKMVSKYDSGFSELQKSEAIEKKMASIGRGGIASDDPTALNQLTEKLNACVAKQNKMKAVNLAAKKGDREALIKLGLSEKTIESINDFIEGGEQVYPSYTLTNNGAEIRRLKKRIEGLNALYTMEPLEHVCDDFQVNVDSGRIHFSFSFGKPSESVRDVLKRQGFKWSRYSETWVRKVNQTAIHVAKLIINELDEIKVLY